MQRTGTVKWHRTYDNWGYIIDDNDRDGPTLPFYMEGFSPERGQVVTFTITTLLGRKIATDVVFS